MITSKPPSVSRLPSKLQSKSCAGCLKKEVLRFLEIRNLLVCECGLFPVLRNFCCTTSRMKIGSTSSGSCTVLAIVNGYSVNNPRHGDSAIHAEPACHKAEIERVSET